MDYFQKALVLTCDQNPVLAQTYVRLGIYLYQEQDFPQADEILQGKIELTQYLTLRVAEWIGDYPAGTNAIQHSHTGSR